MSRSFFKRSLDSRAWVLALGLLALVSAASEAARTRSHDGADSVRTARRIIVGDEGVRIISEDPSEAVETRTRERRPRKGGLVGINDRGVRIRRSLSDSDGVRRISAPGVVVDDDQSGIVRLFADAEVATGEKVDGDVVAVFGSVLVEGEVSGDVVAVFGSVKLGSSGAVGGDVVAVGGALDQAPGASVRGQSVSLGFLPIHWGVPPLHLLLVTVFVGWMLSMFMGWILTLLFPKQMLRIATNASKRAAGSFVLGLLSAPLLVIAIVLLMVTVIGVPIACLLPPLYLFAVWTGQLAASYVLGSRLLRRPLGEGSPMAAMAAGTLFVAMFFILGTVFSGPEGLIRTFALFFNLLGLLLVVALSVIGIGAVLLSRLGTRPRDLDPEPAGVRPTLSQAPASATPAAPPIS